MRIATRELLNDLVELYGDAFKKVAVAMGSTIDESKKAFEKMMKEYEELMAGYDDVYVEEPPPFKYPVPYYKINHRVPKQMHYPKIRATARSTC